MTKFTLILAIFLVPVVMHAQSITPTVIASSGNYVAAGGYTMSSTVGEMTMVKTFSAGGKILTQGFQQSYKDTVLGLMDITQDEYGSFVVYPNPAVDNFYNGFQLPQQGRVDILLYNELGQKVADLYHANYDTGKTIEAANVSNFSAGTYFLSMIFVSSGDGKTHVTTKKLQVIR